VEHDPRYRGGLTITLFKGVRVIAINRSFQQARVADSANSAVLELSPAQTNMMILANRRGEITLSFNPGGTGDGGVAASQSDRSTLDEILGLQPLKQPEPPFVSETYRQDGREVYYFRDGRRVEMPRTDAAPSRTIKQQPVVSPDQPPAPGANPSANSQPAVHAGPAA
jgi:pilus assembly protein CpaB